MIDVTNRTPDVLRDRTEIKKKQEQHYHLIGSVRRVAGHTAFSFNRVTGELKRADLKKEVQVSMNGTPHYSTKICVEKDCIYFQALNMRSAEKKLRKAGIVV